MNKEEAILLVENIIYKLAGWSGIDICELEGEYDFKLDELMEVLRKPNEEDEKLLNIFEELFLKNVIYKREERENGLKIFEIADASDGNYSLRITEEENKLIDKMLDEVKGPSVIYYDKFMCEYVLKKDAFGSFGRYVEIRKNEEGKWVDHYYFEYSYERIPGEIIYAFDFDRDYNHELYYDGLIKLANEKNIPEAKLTLTIQECPPRKFKEMKKKLKEEKNDK